MRNWSFLSNNWDIITILIIYSILAFFCFQYFQYKISGDEISYINVAHAYALGHWGNAINGYWSPLFSWLMAPFILLFGFKPIYGVFITKTVSIIIGFFTILSVWRLSSKFNLDKMVERALLIAFIPSILFFALIYNTPDLLLVFLLISYLTIIFDLEYSKNLINGVICGFIGAMAYLTKSYAFPFFLAHYIMFNLIFFFRSYSKVKKRLILKNLILGLLIFFVVSGLWASNISEKYGTITISTAGEYNQALVGPEYRVNTISYEPTPLSYMGLIKPPNEDATSIWDDVSYLKIVQWSPFDSMKNFEYEFNLLYSNIVYTFNEIENFMPIAVIIVFFMLLFIMRSKLDKLSKNVLKYLLLTMVIYTGGYCLIFPEWRYLWFIFVLLMISSFFMVDRLYKSQIVNLKIRNILLILLICSLVIQPTLELAFFASQKDNSYVLSNTLKEDYDIHGNIASNEWGMITIAYYLKGKYYGATKKTNSSTELENELKNNNIDYYFVWHSKDLQLQDYKEITNGKIAGLKIYKRIN